MGFGLARVEWRPVSVPEPLRHGRRARPATQRMGRVFIELLEGPSRAAGLDAGFWMLGHRVPHTSVWRIGNPGTSIEHPDLIVRIRNVPVEGRSHHCAARARERAFAPYSKFKVGAALETEDGMIVTGCNIENSTYGLTVCAERVAVFKAVSDGHRAFRRIAVVADTRGPDAAVRAVPADPLGVLRRHRGHPGESHRPRRAPTASRTCCRCPSTRACSASRASARGELALRGLTALSLTAMLPTIDWQDDAIVMIDQRKLPTAEVWVRCKTAPEVARAIKTMVIRGAPAIGVAAAMGIALGDAAQQGDRHGGSSPPSSRRPATCWRRPGRRRSTCSGPSSG